MLISSKGGTFPAVPQKNRLLAHCDAGGGAIHSISAVGKEAAQPEENSTTATHDQKFAAGQAETYPMVELKISIKRELDVLAKVMDAVLDVHHYEEPLIFVREDWVSRAEYDPNYTDPNRWWNNGGGLPDRLE